MTGPCLSRRSVRGVQRRRVHPMSSRNWHHLTGPHCVADRRSCRASAPLLTLPDAMTLPRRPCNTPLGSTSNIGHVRVLDADELSILDGGRLGGAEWGAPQRRISRVKPRPRRLSRAEYLHHACAGSSVRRPAGRRYRIRARAAPRPRWRRRSRRSSSCVGRVGCTPPARPSSMAMSAGPTASSSIAATAGRRRFRPSASHRATGSRRSRRTRTHSSTAFYAVPQIGAVLVPINFRLAPDEFQYLLQHSGTTVVCVDREYLDAVDWHSRVAHRRAALRGALGCARRLARLRDADQRGGRRAGTAPDRRARPADHQLHERHDLAPQRRDDHAPQRVGERRRHARAHADDAGRPLPVDAADVPRQRLDVHLDRHRHRRPPRVPAQG